MRTTVDLPEDLHRRARSIARDRGQSLSATVADLVRRGLGERVAVDDMRITYRDGFPVLRTGQPITVDDVRSLDDE